MDHVKSTLPRLQVANEMNCGLRQLPITLMGMIPHGHMVMKDIRNIPMNYVATPLWASAGVKPNIPKVGDLESSGTPECLEFDSKAQNTLH